MTEPKKDEAWLHEEVARVIRMCDGTDIEYHKGCVKFDGERWNGAKLGKPVLSAEAERYEFALAIVKGKPVFVGDSLYTPTGERWEIIAAKGTGVDTFLYGNGEGNYRAECFSWNPTKTVMVELLVQDVEALADRKYFSVTENVVTACRKALGEMKNDN